MGTLFPEYQVKITQSSLNPQKLPSLATARLMEVTTLTRRPSARSSTSAQLMELEVLPSTASSVPTEPSSTRTTSSATGGSMSIALNQLQLLQKRTLKLLLLAKKLLHLSLTEPTLLLKLTLHTLLLPKLPRMLPVVISLLPNMNMTMLKLLTVTLRDLTKEDSKNVP